MFVWNTEPKNKTKTLYSQAEELKNEFDEEKERRKLKTIESMKIRINSGNTYSLPENIAKNILSEISQYDSYNNIHYISRDNHLIYEYLSTIPELNVMEWGMETYKTLGLVDQYYLTYRVLNQLVIESLRVGDEIITINSQKKMSLKYDGQLNIVELTTLQEYEDDLELSLTDKYKNSMGIESSEKLFYIYEDKFNTLIPKRFKMSTKLIEHLNHSDDKCFVSDSVVVVDGGIYEENVGFYEGAFSNYDFDSELFFFNNGYTIYSKHLDLNRVLLFNLTLAKEVRSKLKDEFYRKEMDLYKSLPEWDNK